MMDQNEIFVLNENNRNPNRSSSVIGKNRLLVVLLLFALLVSIIILSCGLAYLFKLKSSYENYKERLMRYEQEAENDVNHVKTSALSTSMASEFRLPKNLIPFYYELYISTDFHDEIEPSDYNGSVKIYFTCTKVTNKVVLNSNGLGIDHTMINVDPYTNDLDKEQVNHETTNVTYDSRKQFLTIQLDKPLEKNRNYSIFIQFKGLLKDDDAGLYRISYKDSKGNKKWLLASQLQPNDARKVFPCFDEPAMKSRFKITIVHHKDFFAMSNMPVAKIIQLPNNTNLTETRFKVSVPMSTYLVAMVVSDFKCKYATANAGVHGKVNVSICGRAEEYDHFDTALQTTVDRLELLEKYFGIKYPMSKCDSVALPIFMMEGMENWGLITYKESCIYHDPVLSSNSFDDSIIVHELAHIWLGNLVTPEWWDDIWLSEGFATFMESINKNSDNLQFIFKTFQLDSVPSSQLISAEVNTPAELRQLFNQITYFKGCIMVRMLKFILGADVFENGMRNYLERYKYKTVNDEQVMNAFMEVQEEENKVFMPSLHAIMDTWVNQSGHPVLHVELVNSTMLKIRQERFLFEQSDVSRYNNTRWYIPFTYYIDKIALKESDKFKQAKREIIWIRPEEKEKLVTLVEPLKSNDFLVTNIDVYGFYRVNYDTQNWDRIFNQLEINHNNIPTLNRAQILNDVFTFSKSGILEATKAFELLGYLENENKYMVWDIAIRHLRDILDMLITTDDVYQDFRIYLANFIKPIYKSLQEDGENEFDMQTTSTVFAFACEVGLDECVTTSTNLFKTWRENESTIEIPAYFKTYVQHNSSANSTADDEWEFLSSKYDNEKDYDTRKMYQKALSRVKDVKLMEMFLNNQLNETKVRRQDSVSGLVYAAESHRHYKLTWDFVKKNWKEIYDRFHYSNFMGLTMLFQELANKFSTEADLEDFSSFFDKHGQYNSFSIIQSIEKIKANISWKKRNLETIRNWLRKNKCCKN